VTAQTKITEMKTALICGISGQDGAYLAKLLLEKGYEVYGASRDVQTSSFFNLIYLGIKGQVKFESVALNDFHSVLQVLMKVKPDEIYNLAGQSSVGLSFQRPVETLESISIGSLNLLEAIRNSKSFIKSVVVASSDSTKSSASDFRKLVSVPLCHFEVKLLLLL
jgi:GDPmannose 4,6-dehydratase